MARIYKLTRTGLKLVYKIRHHKGHGIHSPFVFNLIIKVVEEKTPYYVYNDIKSYIDLQRGGSFKPDKINRLSFRLINYFGSKHILELGSGTGTNTLYLTSPASDILCHSVELDPSRHGKARQLYENWSRNIILHHRNDFDLIEKQDCIYINLQNYKSASEKDFQLLNKLVHKKTFIIVEGIRTNKRHRMLWKRIMNMESRTAVLDLFNVGIVFFDDQLYPWKYQISF